MRVDTDGDPVAQESIVPAHSWSVLPSTGLLWVCLAVVVMYLTREGIYKFCTDLVIFDREREDHLYVGVWELRGDARLTGLGRDPLGTVRLAILLDTFHRLADDLRYPGVFHCWTTNGRSRC
jgi:hypothetical protein